MAEVTTAKRSAAAAETLGPPPQGEPAPDIVAPPPGNPRFPLFDSVRALAALAIVGVHVGLFSRASESWYGPLVAHLDIGVPIFFLLSGFLLYRPMLSAQVLGTPRTPHPIYGLRRFLRIFPAYWVVITVAAVIPGVYGVFSGNWWVYYGLLQNYPIYTITPDCLSHPLECGDAPTWSLAVEVFFYLLLPFYAAAMAWITSRVRSIGWLPLVLGSLLLLSVVSVFIQKRYGTPGDLYPVLFFSPLGRAWWFSLGMGLAAISVWIQERGRQPAAVSWLGRHHGYLWLAAAALYVLPALFLFKESPLLAAPFGFSMRQYLFSYLLVGVIALLILLPAVFDLERNSVPQRILAHRSLAWLGLISYGIFLWHYPIMLWVVERGGDNWWPGTGMSFPLLLLATLAVTLVCATLSYYLLERPLMRLKYRRRLSGS
jgi:peptidoglycan/LPS O-acetylase OafA/YrhL